MTELQYLCIQDMLKENQLDKNNLSSNYRSAVNWLDKNDLDQLNEWLKDLDHSSPKKY